MRPEEARWELLEDVAPQGEDPHESCKGRRVSFEAQENSTLCRSSPLENLETHRDKVREENEHKEVEHCECVPRSEHYNAKRNRTY